MEKTLAIVGAGRALAPVKECGAAVGSMHPLQTFSGVGVPDLEGFAVEGDVVAVRLEANRPSAGRIAGAHCPRQENPVSRRRDARLGPSTCLGGSGDAVAHLARDEMQRSGPRAAWTGPLARGGYKIVEAHYARSAIRRRRSPKAIKVLVVLPRACSPRILLAPPRNWKEVLLP